MPRTAASQKPEKRAFVYRGGVRIAGTVLACDATAGSDLVFVSHAPAPGQRGRRALPRVGTGRRRLLATEATLALLGNPGGRGRAHALVASYGRPFQLGGLRVEVFPSGLTPGSASLLCEGDGRRVVYSGPIGAGPEVETRAADALCLDAGPVREDAPSPTRAEALAALLRGVREVQGAGRAPVLLFDSVEVSLIVAAALTAEGIAARAHRDIMQAAGAYREAGVPAIALSRFGGKLGAGEVVLWPAKARPPQQRKEARPASFLLVGPPGAPPAPPAGVDAEATVAVGVPFRAGFAALLRYVEATGASEVALVNSGSEDQGEPTELERALRARGLEVYALGPPRQAELFSARAA